MNDETYIIVGMLTVGAGMFGGGVGIPNKAAGPLLGFAGFALAASAITLAILKL